MKRSSLQRGAAPVRRTRLKPVRIRSKSGKPGYRHTKKYLDNLCRLVVFARDKDQCLKCGKPSGSKDNWPLMPGPSLQWAHVESRRYTATRWDPRFSMTLCAGHHLWWHHRPVEAAQWWTETFPERARDLKLARAFKQKVDLELIRLFLEAEATKYGIPLTPPNKGGP